MRTSRIWILAVLGAAVFCFLGASPETSVFSIVVDGETMVSDSDILEFDWSEFKITLAGRAIERIREQWPCSMSDYGSWPSSFAVQVEGDILFKGRFQAGYSSHLPEGPLIPWPPFMGENFTDNLGFRIW